MKGHISRIHFYEDYMSNGIGGRIQKIAVSNEFESQFRRELQRRGRESGQQLTNQQAFDQGIHAQILQRMLTDAVVSLDANDLGIGVNRKTARRVVEEITTFQNDITGEFSEDKLNEILAQNRITRATFENDIYNTLRRQQTVHPAIQIFNRATQGYGTDTR